MRFRDQQGFTLPEIMVAMIISSIIISLALSLFLFSNKLFKMWYDGTELKSAVNRTVQVMSYDIQRSSEMVGLSDSTMTLRLAGGRELAYRFSRDSVIRNDVGLFTGQDGQMKLTVKPVSGQTSRLYRIKAVGICRNSHYEAETLAAIPYSSRAPFYMSP